MVRVDVQVGLGLLVAVQLVSGDWDGNVILIAASAQHGICRGWSRNR